jgi:integrase
VTKENVMHDNPRARRPVYSGNRRIPGLYERTLADGTAVYEAGLRLDGRPTRRRLVARTKTDAILELRTLEVDHARGEAHRSPASALTVADLAEGWLAHLESRVGARDPRRRYSRRTVELYRQRLHRHIVPALGRQPVADVVLADVRRVVDQLAGDGLAPGTVTSVIGILSGLLRFAVRSGHIERNPVRDLDRDDRPGTGRLTEPRYLNAEEVEALLLQMSDVFRPVAASCAYAGLRVSEALGLRWCDVDFAAGTVSVSAQLAPDGTRVPLKTAASAATVPLLPKLAAELKAHRSRVAGQALARVQPEELVFTTLRGKPQSRRNVLRAVHAAGDTAGLNGEGRERVGVHDLRHSFVAVALAAGLTLPEAAALARHANPRVTAAVYAGLTDAGRAGLGEKLASAFGG